MNFLFPFLQISGRPNPISTGVVDPSAAGGLTNFLLPALLGLAALAYIFMPIWAGASKRSIRASDSVVYGLEELDLDHDLGKIDEGEWQARRPALVAMARPKTRRVDIETLIRGFRRARRVELAVEAEVLIARAKKWARRPEL